jgi:hypothetical protein
MDDSSFTVCVAERKKDEETFKIMFQYNGYQLWESPVKAFYSSHSQDFIIMNKDGMSFIRLDRNKARRPLSRKL